MASKRKIGILFGSHFLSLVDTDHQTPKNFISIPYASPQELPVTPSIDPVKITGLIQKTLRDHNMPATEAGLSLASKDIIFRSFIIPWMNPNEVKGVVEFEVRKYIPFKLSELNYTYHTVTITEKGAKSLRVVFCAVKSDVLENYCNILEQSGLTVTVIEPAPLSLVRALIFKKILPKDKRIAIIEADDKEGKISIVDQSVPQFIRDFQLAPANPQAAIMNVDLANARLFNEIRVSFDYYARQSSQDKINGLMALAPSPTAAKEFSDNLAKEFSLPVTSVNSQTILNSNTPLSLELLSAFGACLRSSVSLPAQFDLSRIKASAPLPKVVKTPAVPVEVTPVNVSSSVKVATACVGGIVIAFLIMNYRLDQVKNQINALTAQEGIFSPLSIDEIEQKTTDSGNKQTDYKNVRIKSHAAFFLSVIPPLLPEGVWLKEFIISYTDTLSASDLAAVPAKGIDKKFKVSVALAGFVYNENTNQQIRLAKKFTSNLVENKNFSNFFEAIELVTAQTQQLGRSQIPVTSFKIECR